MKSNFSKNSVAVLAVLLIWLPAWYLLFKILPENGVDFWTLVERLSQWKPVALKGWGFVVLLAIFLASLGVFIFASLGNLDD